MVPLIAEQLKGIKNEELWVCDAVVIVASMQVSSVQVLIL